MWAALARALQRVPLLAVTAALLLSACQPESTPYFGVDIKGAGYGQQWALIDQNGQPRTPADFRGKLQLFYFGFTQCPDICPVTLGHLKSALTLLGPQRDQVRALFVTVDAVTDTPAVLKSYLAGFGPDFIGLTGTQTALAAAAKDFRVYSKRKEGSGASFEHAGFVYLLDRTGAPRLLYGPEATPAGMASDFKRLLVE